MLSVVGASALPAGSRSVAVVAGDLVSCFAPPQPQGRNSHGQPADGTGGRGLTGSCSSRHLSRRSPSVVLAFLLCTYIGVVDDFPDAHCIVYKLYFGLLGSRTLVDY